MKVTAAPATLSIVGHICWAGAEEDDERAFSFCRVPHWPSRWCICNAYGTHAYDKLLSPFSSKQVGGRTCNKICTSLAATVASGRRDKPSNVNCDEVRHCLNFHRMISMELDPERLIDLTIRSCFDCLVLLSSRDPVEPDSVSEKYR